jgi:hypothetical protein
LFVGKAIALSILHGGPGPIFLSPLIVDYPFGGIRSVKPCVDDVFDEGLRMKILKICVFFICIVVEVFGSLLACRY